MIVTDTRRRGRLMMALGLIWASLLSPAMRSAEPEAYTLHIASQPLERALQEFARQSGLEIIFLSNLIEGQRAAALDGHYTVDEALKTLLAYSTLTFRRVNAKTIEIRALRRRPDRGN